jgi:hypothetical protein
MYDSLFSANMLLTQYTLLYYAVHTNYMLIGSGPEHGGEFTKVAHKLAECFSAPTLAVRSTVLYANSAHCFTVAFEASPHL